MEAAGGTSIRFFRFIRDTGTMLCLKSVALKDLGASSKVCEQQRIYMESLDRDRSRSTDQHVTLPGDIAKSLAN